MKHVHIVRSYLPSATIGYMDLPHKRLYSLELPWKDNAGSVSCIPEGTYLVKRDRTGKHQFYAVQNVPNRTNIEWHIGNYTKNVLGCTAFGQSRMNDNISVSSSELALKDIVEYFGEEDFLVTYRAFNASLDSLTI